MHCASCGARLLEGKLFCHVCGAAAASACPHCQAPIQAEFSFCPDCGGSLGPEPAARAKPAPELPARPPPGLPAAAAAQPSAPIAGERKRVTVLFCDLAGSTAIAETLDPELYRELLDRYLEPAIREIDRMDGIVNQLAGDGFMALFGAPIAHEDEPERAIRAGLAIQDALSALNRERVGRGEPELRARIGIHTGPVVVGTVGNDLKMDYTAIGDTTNLAARLQGLADPGSILVSATTRNLVAGQFELRETPPVEVKGKREPVVAFEVLGITEAVTPMAIAEARGLTPLVGFSQELAQLEACFDRLEGLLPQLVSVVGDPGSGKSRLVYEFKQRLADRKAVLLEARASALTQSVPFAPLTSMMKQFFGLAAGEEIECACDKIAARVRQWDESLEDIYPAMCQLLATPTEASQAEGQRERTMEAFSKLIGGVVRTSPVVIILEDLHWLDEASRDLIERQISMMEALPVMALVTHRPEYQPNWQIRSAFTQLTLRPFSDAQAAEIARARAGGPLPAELERRIVKRAEGNPFFVEEITRALVEQGQIVADEFGVRVTGPVDQIRIPDTVQELIEARLDRLTPQAKRVAQVASVFGRQFRIDQLTLLLEPENVDLHAGMRELVERGLIHSASAERGEYRFGESLTQSVCYEGLLMRERRELHERIANMIEEDPRGMTAERAGLIAHHLARSENRLKAIDSLLAAARNAAELPSYPSAAALYRQAWDLAEQALAEAPDERTRRWVLEATMGACAIAVLYPSPGGHDEERAARRGEELADQLGDDEALARMLGFHGSLVEASGGTRFAEGLAMKERGLEVARKLGNERAVISAERALAMSYLMDGRFEDARDALARVTHSLEVLGEHHPPSDLYLSIGYFRALSALREDDLDLAFDVARSLYDACVEYGNETLVGASTGILSQVHFARAEYTEAKTWADRALASGKKTGSVGAIRGGAVVTIASRLELGETVNPARFLEHVDGELDATADAGLTGHMIVELLIQLGELERATRMADRLALNAGGRVRQIQSLLATAYALCARGSAHLQEAEEEYRLAAAVAREIGSVSFEIAASIGLASIALHRCEAGQASVMLREAADDAETAGLARLRDQALRRLADATDLGQSEADKIPPPIN